MAIFQRKSGNFDSKRIFHIFPVLTDKDFDKGNIDKRIV
tara:strand:- start:2401 stop:2517 length:117 start_codon:yes stop_codon:yes gene_type:complete